MAAVKDSMSNLDIAALMPNLARRLSGAWLNNIYQMNGIFLFKIRSEGGDALTLLLERGRRIHFTSFRREVPKTPSRFIMSLRQKIKNSKIIGVKQHDLDRLVYLLLLKGKEKYTLIFELFGEGNILLVNEQNQILYALKYVRMRDRSLLPKKPYLYPPIRGINPFEVNIEGLKEILSGSSRDIIRTLVSNLNLAGDYAEEILLNSNIGLKSQANNISDDQMKRLLDSLTSTINKIKNQELDPKIIYDRDGRMISVIPFSFIKYEGYIQKSFNDFNEAIDSYFTETETVSGKATDKADSKKDSLKRIRSEQIAAVNLLTEKITLHKTIGDIIYSNYAVIDELLKSIQTAKQKNFEWPEIIDKLNTAKIKKIPSAVIFNELNLREAKLTVQVNGVKFDLDFRKSINENADYYYELSKREEAKLKGALTALQATETRLRQTEESSGIEIKTGVARKVRRKEWYEKFRWFMTSDNLLVVGGKDIRSNELLIKKYLDKNDKVFHADIRGAPIVIVKAKGEEPSEKALSEASQFAASYSNSWSRGAGQVDVYCVNHDQISFSPPSGQYLPKGSFIINGPRTYFRNQPLALSFGVSFKEGFAIPVCGPPSAIEKQTKISVPIRIGDLTAGKLAKKIKEYLLSNISREERRMIEDLSVDEIQNLLPPGGADIVVGK